MLSKRIIKKNNKNNKNNKESMHQSKVDYINLTSLTDAEREIITNTIALKSKSVREIMVPRVDVVMVSLNTPYEKIIKAFNRERNSRIPVYKDDDIDDIIGVLYTKDLVEVTGKNFFLKKYLHKPYFVPISISLIELLRNFREKRVHIAMVVDEYGGFSGIVSMEDVLEQIVGDIKDEFDETEETIKQNEDGSFLVDARLKIDVFNKYTKLPILPDADADTVGGFLFVHLGRLPKRNEGVRYKNYVFTVVGKSGNIVTKIRVEKKENKENRENKAAQKEDSKTEQNK